MWPFVDVYLKKQERGQKRSSLCAIVFCRSSLFAFSSSINEAEREREREREQCEESKSKVFQIGKITKIFKSAVTQTQNNARK